MVESPTDTDFVAILDDLPVIISVPTVNSADDNVSPVHIRNILSINNQFLLITTW